MNSDFLVCPVCHAPLQLLDNGYHCAFCERVYPIVDGIPDFFIAGDESSPVWAENLIWLDPAMVEARDAIYRLSVRELRGMAFAMRELAACSFPGCRILEVGTGTGHLTQWMAEVVAPGTEIISFDYAWPMFEKARANITCREGVLLLRANAIGALPFLPASFDVVFLRLAPLGPPDVWNVRTAFDLLKPGGWLFKSGWKSRPETSSWTEEAIQVGYDSAEVHEWQYPRRKSRAEYDANLVELERAVAFGAPRDLLALPAWEGEAVTASTWENLRIAHKPAA